MAFATKPKPKATPSHKKRTGNHRKQNQQYLKHYWPYLPLLAIVAVGLLCNALWPKGMDVLGASSDMSVATLLTDTNQQRSLYKEDSLSVSDSLNQAAAAKAKDMVASNYWSHNTPDGRTPWSFIAASGYNYAKAGENLAYGFSDAGATVTAWMHSPEHRKNILDSGYTQVGFGIATSKNYVGHGPETVVVAMYGRPSSAAAPLQLTAAEGSVKGAQQAAAPISRLAVMDNSSAQLMSVLIVSASALAAAVFVAKHSRLLHRSLVRGEAFIVQHYALDLVLVIIVTAGIVLTRAAGFVL